MSSGAQSDGCVWPSMNTMGRELVSRRNTRSALCLWRIRSRQFSRSICWPGQAASSGSWSKLAEPSRAAYRLTESASWKRAIDRTLDCSLLTQACRLSPDKVSDTSRLLLGSACRKRSEASSLVRVEASRAASVCIQSFSVQCSRSRSNGSQSLARWLAGTSQRLDPEVRRPDSCCLGAAAASS